LIIDGELARPRFNMFLMSLFGLVALILAAVGVYGLLAYLVTQRTQEIGIRLALGAKVTQVKRMVVIQGMRLALVGVVVGIALAFAFARAMGSFLFGVKSWDPAVFVVAPVVLTLVALLAAWIPAGRASRVNPNDALRYE